MHTESEADGHFLCQLIRIDHIVIILINIYGYNSKSENDLLLEKVDNFIMHWLSQFPNCVILVGGDFNMVLDNFADCWPPRTSSNQSTNLKLLMDKFSLIDIWREKCPGSKLYTWSNKTCTRQYRLDYWLVSNSITSADISVNILTAVRP